MQSNQKKNIFLIYFFLLKNELFSCPFCVTERHLNDNKIEGGGEKPYLGFIVFGMRQTNRVNLTKISKNK